MKKQTILTKGFLLGLSLASIVPNVLADNDLPAPFTTPAHTLTQGLSPTDLIDLILPVNSGVTVIGGTQMLNGSTATPILTDHTYKASGRFDWAVSDANGPALTPASGIPFSSGIILSTGNVNDSVGPNNAEDMTTIFGAPGSALIEAYLNFNPGPGGFYTGKSRDAIALEFEFNTFKSGNTEIDFQYMFASEEYREYVGDNFNDAFGFFLEDITDSTIVNVALIPSTTTPVSINTVNENVNSQYYSGNPQRNTLSPWDIQYDGLVGGGNALTLSSHLDVDPTHDYRIIFVIADMSDGKLDSSVFIKADSFVGSNPVPEPSTYVGALALAGLIARRLRRKA